MNATMYITVQVRDVYGRTLVYPADETSATFARLLNVKTFNAHQVACIRDLGYAVHVANVATGQLPEGY